MPIHAPDCHLCERALAVVRDARAIREAEEAAAIPLRVSGLGSRSRPAGAVGNAAEHILLPE